MTQSVLSSILKIIINSSPKYQIRRGTKANMFNLELPATLLEKTTIL